MNWPLSPTVVFSSDRGWEPNGVAYVRRVERGWPQRVPQLASLFPNKARTRNDQRSGKTKVLAGPGPLSWEDKITSCVLCQLTPLPVFPFPKSPAFPGTFQWPRVVLLSLILGSYWIWSPCLCPMVLTLYPIYHCSTKWKESISSAFTTESWSWTWVRIRISYEGLWSVHFNHNRPKDSGDGVHIWCVHMFGHVVMCVLTCMCLCVCSNVRIHPHGHLCECIFMCMHALTCGHVCVYVWMHIHV